MAKQTKMAATHTMSMTTRKTVFCCFAFTEIGDGFQPVVVASAAKRSARQTR
jgi:hypothetical protein